MDILANSTINYDNILGKVEATDKEKEIFAVNNGDILFQRSSETLEDVGRANVYLDNRAAVYGGFVIRGRKIGNYDPLFFKFLLATPLARKMTCRMGAGAQHFNIGQDGLAKVSVHVPCLNEQIKIATLLRLLDERIDTQNKIIEDLKLQREAIIEQSYKASNNLLRLGDLITQTSTRNKRNLCNNVLSVSNKYGFVSQSEQFEDRIIASEDTSNYKVVYENDFAYNPARINVGSIARYKEHEPGIISPMYISFSTNTKLAPPYLEYFFKTQHFYNEMKKRLEGSVRQCLTFEGLCDVSIPILPIEEQEVAANGIQLFTNTISIEEKYLYALRKQRLYILQQMFI